MPTSPRRNSCRSLPCTRITTRGPVAAAVGPVYGRSPQLFVVTFQPKRVASMLESLVGVVLGGLITVTVAAAIEMLRRPHLAIALHEPLDRSYGELSPAREARFLVVYAGNRPLPRGLRWMTRNTATQCLATLDFCRLDGQRLFSGPIVARWSSAPEPTNDVILVNGDPWGQIVKTGRSGEGSRIDIPADGVEELGVAAMFDQEVDCYAWNQESYHSDPVWRRQDRRLAPGTYLVFVSVRSQGEVVTRGFRLICERGRTEFRLVPTLETDASTPF